MKAFAFLALLVLARAAEWPENTYWASDEEVPYDVRFDTEADGADWVEIDSLDVDIAFSAPESSHVSVGPCTLKGSHQQIKLAGTVRHPTLKAMVVFNPDTEIEEMHMVDLFDAEERGLHMVANVPHEILLETDDPVIYFEPDGGHEHRMGECSQITSGVEYTSDKNQLRDISTRDPWPGCSGPGNSCHTGGWMHGGFKVGCKHHGVHFTGNGNWNKKHAKIGWRKKCPGNAHPGCSGPGKSRAPTGEDEEVEVISTDHELLSGLNATIDVEVTSSFENAPFQIWLAYDEESLSADLTLDGERPTVTRAHHGCSGPGNGNCPKNRNKWHGWGGRSHRCKRPFPGNHQG